MLRQTLSRLPRRTAILLQTHIYPQAVTPLRHSSSSSSSSSSPLPNITSHPASWAPPKPAAHPPLPKPDFLDAAESTIWDLLTDAFHPTELQVRDVSGGCGSMYAIDITSHRFKGLGMLKQQRLVNETLKDLMGGWHGVQLRTKAT